MAKSMRLTDFDDNGNSMASLPSGNFWEHWFENQSPLQAMKRHLDEHKIWEKAVGIGILAIKDAEG
jgi:hypothetical protein